MDYASEVVTVWRYRNETIITVITTELRRILLMDYLPIVALL